MNKPVRLEINEGGSWRVIGRLDAGDDEWLDAVLGAAENLSSALGWDDDTRCPKLRVVIDDSQYPTLPTATRDMSVIMVWAHDTGWRDAATGEPA